MKRILKYIYLLGLSLTMFATSCSDPGDEVTDIEYARLFTPAGFTAKVVNRTNVRLTWNTTKNADAYAIEVYDNESYEGTPVRTINDVKESPYTIEYLDGDKNYWVRIQAVATEHGSSKWAEATVKTDSEQIFYSVDDEDRGKEDVTLRWPAGQTATKITLISEDGKTTITHTVTATEIAAGVVKITGLAQYTVYEAVLINVEKERGRISFETKGDAIIVTPDEDFADILLNATAGDIFALQPGTYGTSTKFVIKAGVQIIALKSSQKPVINGYLSVEDGASLLLKDIILDGTGNVSNQAIIFATASVTYGALTIESCEIKNHDKGLYYLNVAAVVESITINNCLIHDIVCNGGDFMDSRVGAIKVITLSSSTVYNSCAARDFIRYDDASGSFAGVAPIINVTNCTLVGICNGTSRRLLYIRFKNNTINFKNVLVANSLGIFTNQASTAVPAFSKNNFFNAPNLSPGGATSNFYDSSATKLDPQFTDAATGNFTVNNLDVSAGDPRWLK